MRSVLVTRHVTTTGKAGKTHAIMARLVEDDQPPRVVLSLFLPSGHHVELFDLDPSDASVDRTLAFIRNFNDSEMADRLCCLLDGDSYG